MKNKGITLIALVITIVVLIILAAVAINLSLVNNGILNRAKTGKELFQNSQDYEETEVREMANQIDEHIEGNRDNNFIIVDSFLSEDKTSGYIKYNNGFIQQWGKLYMSSLAKGGTNTTMNLLTAFATTTYNVQVTQLTNGDYANVTPTITSTQTSSISFRIWNASSSKTTGYYNWYAFGF